MKLTATDRQTIPPGTYPATLRSIEEKLSDTGPYLLWTFAIPSKQGELTQTATSSMNFGPTAKPRKWSEQLLGRSFRPGEEIETDDLLNRPCQLLLSVTNKNGTEYNVVDAVLAIAKPQSDLF